MVIGFPNLGRDERNRRSQKVLPDSRSGLSWKGFLLEKLNVDLSFSLLRYRVFLIRNLPLMVGVLDELLYCPLAGAVVKFARF